MKHQHFYHRYLEWNSLRTIFVAIFIVATTLFVIDRESRGLMPRMGIHHDLMQRWRSSPYLCPMHSTMLNFWFCDPIRISMLRTNCKSYTFGHGNIFDFEMAVHSINKDCEIHSFDPMITW